MAWGVEGGTMLKTTSLGLSKQKESTPIGEGSCPNCGFKHMNIYEGDGVHSGSCSNGGHIAFERWSGGYGLSIKVVEMSESEFGKLPEYDG